MGKGIMSHLASAEKLMADKKPQIFTGLAVVGVLLTAKAAWSAGIKAKEILNEYHKDLEYVEKGDKEAKKATTMEMIKKMTPVVAPVVAAAGTSITCAILSQKESTRRLAAMSAACTVAENSLKNLNQKMNDILGDKKTQSIKEAVTKEQFQKDGQNKVPEDVEKWVFAAGEVLCKDLYSGRYFRSNAQKIENAINQLSYRLQSEMWVSLNDLYSLIGSPDLDPIPMGEDLGWNVESVDRGRIPITLTALLTEDKRPCLCVESYIINTRRDLRGGY